MKGQERRDEGKEGMKGKKRDEGKEEMKGRNIKTTQKGHIPTDPTVLI